MSDFRTSPRVFAKISLASISGHISVWLLAVDNATQPMESLSETKWDVVIAGTGLAQSLLALSVL